MYVFIVSIYDCAIVFAKLNFQPILARKFLFIQLRKRHVSTFPQKNVKIKRSFKQDIKRRIVL